MRRDVDFDTLDSISRNDFGYTLGGGVMGYFTDHVGLRGDLRYFRNFQVDDIDLTGVDFERGTFNFGRATVGAAVPLLSSLRSAGEGPRRPPAACALEATPMRASWPGSRMASAASIRPIVLLWLAGVGLAGSLGFAAGLLCRAATRATRPLPIRPASLSSDHAVLDVAEERRGSACGNTTPRRGWVTLSAGAAHLSGLARDATRVRPEGLHERVYPADMPRADDRVQRAIAGSDSYADRAPGAGR